MSAPMLKMSAYRSHTCLLKSLIRLKPHKSYSRTFCLKQYNENTNLFRVTKYLSTLLIKIPCCCKYSKQTGSLTDEILKAKVTPDISSNETGQKEKKWWRKSENAWKIGLVSLLTMSGLSAALYVDMYGSPPRDPEGNIIEDEFSKDPKLIAYFKRAYKVLRSQKDAIIEPSREKLLPDPVQYPYYQPPYTVVFEINDVLVHPDWTYGTGWRFKKRPHLEYFLSSIAAPLYEVVVYTQDSGLNADPIIHNMDQKGYINYRLYRDATRYMNGHHVKDLGCLNRDLSKVIFIDWNEKSYSLNPRNAFKLKRWDGEDDDRTLIDLANFLQAVAASKVSDVREVLDYYKQFDDPLEAFKDNQRKLQEEQEKKAKMLQEREKNKPSIFSLSGLTRKK